MAETKSLTSSGHKPPARESKVRLRNLLKQLEHKEDNLKALLPFERDIENLALGEEEILKVKVLFSSHAEIGKYNNLHSTIMTFGSQYFIGIKDDKRQIVKLVPEKNSDFLLCENLGKTPYTTLGMYIDRNAMEETNAASGKTRYRNFIINSAPEIKTVYLRHLTRDFVIDTFTSSTMEQLTAYAKKIDCKDFNDYKKDPKFVTFIL